MQAKYRGRQILVGLCATILLAGVVHGGLGPQNVIVVIDEDVPESVAIGEYYIQQRGIPACCVFRVNSPPLGNLTEVLDNLANPLKQYLADEGLTDQVDVIVLTRGIPYKVDVNSMASMLHSERSDTWPGYCYYGKNGLRNPFYQKSSHFDYNRQYERDNIPLENRRIVMMLSGFTVEGAMNNIDSSVYGDETFPAGTIYMISAPQSSGLPRLYPRHDQIPKIRALLTSMGVASEHKVVTSESAAQYSNKTDVLGYLTGRSTLSSLDSLTFLPGSWGDHLTSFGGDLLNQGGQTSILEITDRGAAGSAGTVAEPCNYWQKFPHAVLYERYAKGFSLAEAAWMSVEQPWQTIFVGDPLSAPYAVKPIVEINAPADGRRVRNSVNLDLTVYHPAGDAISLVELYVDGKFAETIATFGPAAGNEVTLTCDDVQYTYVVTGGETSSYILQDLYANVGNTPTDGRMYMIGSPGEIGFLRVRSRVTGTAGNGVPYSLTVSQGSGEYLGVFPRVDGPVTAGGMEEIPDDEVDATYGFGHVYLSVGVPAANIQHTFDTSGLSAGEHELMIVAYQGDEIFTQGHARVTIAKRVPQFPTEPPIRLQAVLP